MLQTIHAERDIPYQTSFVASKHDNDGKHHLLLAASGSVATIKIQNILKALSHHDDLAIRLVLTKSATYFLQGQSLEQPHLDSLKRIKNVEGIYLDESEWIHPWKRGHEILHIELRRWAHMLVIAPLSANTLAKITGGFSDNLLTSVVRAWDTTGVVEKTGLKKRIIVCPAMNTFMWRHPVTKSQIRVLKEDWGVGEGNEEGDGTKWFTVLLPVEKELACGDVGDGAMREWSEVVKAIEQRFGI